MTRCPARRSCRARGAFLALLLIAASPPAGRAAELLLYDGVMTYGDSDNAFYWFGVPASSPADWTSPDDYAAGEWHARFEIIAQPSYATYHQPTGLQSCVWQDGKGGDYPETCSSIYFLDGPGAVEYTVESPADWWQKADSQASAAPFDWARGDDFVDMGSPAWHRNEDGSRCLATIASWGGCEQNMDVHLPMTIRITIVIVSSGAVFSGWDNYGFGQDEPDPDGGLDGGGDQAQDGGGDLVEDADGGRADDDGMADRDAGADGGGAGDLDLESPVDGGCKCSASASSSGLVLLLLFWLLFRPGRH